MTILGIARLDKHDTLSYQKARLDKPNTLSYQKARLDKHDTLSYQKARLPNLIRFLIRKRD